MTNLKIPPNVRVLVIEDDLSLKLPMERMLRAVEPRMELTWVTSAEQATVDAEIKYGLMGRPYDLIIADVNLEGKRTGLEFWRDFQSRHLWTPFLFTSGMSEAEFTSKASDGGVTPPFLSKPMVISEYMRVVGRFLRYRVVHGR